MALSLALTDDDKRVVRVVVKEDVALDVAKEGQVPEDSHAGLPVASRVTRHTARRHTPHGTAHTGSVMEGLWKREPCQQSTTH